VYSEWRWVIVSDCVHATPSVCMCQSVVRDTGPLLLVMRFKVTTSASLSLSEFSTEN